LTIRLLFSVQKLLLGTLGSVDVNVTFQEVTVLVLTLYEVLLVETVTLDWPLAFTVTFTAELLTAPMLQSADPT